MMMELDFRALVKDLCNGVVNDNGVIDIVKLQSDIEEFILLDINVEAINIAKQYAEENGWEVQE